MKIDDAFKPLLESGVINKETHTAINEAWESKLNEAREQVRAELREEFAQRHEHDKDALVSALDKMVREGLETELKEFKQDRKLIAEDRVKNKQLVRENMGKVNEFMITKLTEEIKELRAERKIQLESQNKLEQFVIRALAEEIKEFSQDKKAVVEAKVKLVAEGKQKMAQLQDDFIKENAERVNRMVSKHMKSEMTQLREDIQKAKQNNFGRKIFEAYMSEFSSSYMNEKAETKKLMRKLQETEQQLHESISAQQKAKLLIESKEKELKRVQSANVRDKTMSELLGTLNAEKASTMKSLLEGVQTAHLKREYDKYLPAVLNGATKPKSKTMISEGKVVTGDKVAQKQPEIDQGEDEIAAIKRLARDVAGR